MQELKADMAELKHIMSSVLSALQRPGADSTTRAADVDAHTSSASPLTPAAGKRTRSAGKKEMVDGKPVAQMEESTSPQPAPTSTAAEAKSSLEPRDPLVDPGSFAFRSFGRTLLAESNSVRQRNPQSTTTATAPARPWDKVLVRMREQRAAEATTSGRNMRPAENAARDTQPTIDFIAPSDSGDEEGEDHTSINAEASRTFGEPENHATHVSASSPNLYARLLSLRSHKSASNRHHRRNRVESEELRSSHRYPASSAALSSIASTSRSFAETRATIDDLTLLRHADSVKCNVSCRTKWFLDQCSYHMLRPSSRVTDVLDVVYVLAVVGMVGISLMPLHLYTTGDPSVGSPVQGMAEYDFALAVAACILGQVYTMMWTVARFIEPVRNPRDPWEVARTPFEVYRLYVRGPLRRWFYFDLFMSLPIEWIFLGWRWDWFFGLMVRHIARVARFVSFAAGNDPLNAGRHRLRLFCAIAILALALHAIATGFWALENGMTYTTALYWTFTTVSTVGYGDVVPTGTTRIYACFTMALSLCTFSALTAYATMVLTRRDARTEREVDATSHMDAMLTYYGLPDEYRRRITQYFPSLIEQEHEEQFRQLVSGLPQREREQIGAFVHAKALREIDVFANVSFEDLLVLCQRLQRRLYPSEAEIFAQGDPGTEMYFLTRGTADIVRIHPKALAPVKLDCPRVFGEMALLENCTRSAWVVATSPCEVLVLTRADFDAHVRGHARLFGIIQGIAKKRQVDNRRHATVQAARFIREESVFRDLDEDTITALATYLDPEIAEANSVVMTEGTISDCMYFIVSGTAVALVQNEPGMFAVVGSFKRGDLFGEMEMVSMTPCFATIRATSRLELLRLQRKGYNMLRRERPTIESLLRYLSESRCTSRNDTSVYFRMDD
jgi:CRP-like cAMP-binding protein